jgi:hypothetical protein
MVGRKSTLEFICSQLTLYISYIRYNIQHWLALRVITYPFKVALFPLNVLSLAGGSHQLCVAVPLHNLRSLHYS